MGVKISMTCLISSSYCGYLLNHMKNIEILTIKNHYLISILHASYLATKPLLSSVMTA